MSYEDYYTLFYTYYFYFLVINEVRIVVEPSILSQLVRSGVYYDYIDFVFVGNFNK